MGTKTQEIVGETPKPTYTVGVQNENFSAKITEIAESNSISILESVVLFCDFHDITLKKAAKMLSPKLISLIAEEEGIEGVDVTQIGG